MIRALLIVLILTATASAEWVNIDRFGGLITSSGLDVPISSARLADGWMIRNGRLEKQHFTRYACNDVTNNPAYIVGHSATSNAVIYYADKLRRVIDGSCDAVGYSIPVRADSAYTKATTDSTLYNWEHLNQSVATETSYWLNFTLSDRSSTYWGDTNYSVNHFYSNRWIQLNRTAGRLDTLPLNPDIPTLSITEGTSSIDYPDTTLIFDGNYIWKYAGDDDAIVGTGSTTITYPRYADTTRVWNVYAIGDTQLVMVIDPVDSIYTGTADSTDAATKYWILWDDTLRSSRALPCSVLYAKEYATGAVKDSIVCYLLADSSNWAGVQHFWGRSDTTATVAGASGSRHMYAVLYRPGKVTRYKDLGQHSFGSSGGVPYTIDSLISTWKVGQFHYATWHTHFNKGSGVLNWTGITTRLTHANVWEITTDASPFGDNDTCRAILLQWDTLSDNYANKYWGKFLLFDKDTIKASVWGTGAETNNLNYLMYRPPLTDWSVSTTGSTASNYRFAVLHRQRSWAGGNPDSLTLMYSGIVNNSPTGTAGTGVYSVFPSANRVNFEGFDKNTGLSSLGNQLVYYKRRGISTMTGFAVPDFYTQPAPVGIGAVNHGSIARSVQDNADAIVNENGMFLFAGNGLEPLSPQIVEVFSDSINWNSEAKIRGTVWDNMYFVTAPFGDTNTTNNRIVGLDLETKDAWTMSKPKAASVWNFKDDDGSEEMYLGSQDSSLIWRMDGPRSDLYYVSDWRSGWSDLGVPENVKTVDSYRIEYKAAAANDTVYVDWYKDFVTAAAHTDVIVSSAAGMATLVKDVPRSVNGKYLSFGIRSPDSAMVVNRFGFEWRDSGTRRK